MYKEKRILAIIPARGGSKGLPGKNIINFMGKPLIFWTIDAVRQVLDDEFICVSTDDDKIISVVESYGLSVPFKRPANLASDVSSTNDVILHALEYYKSKGKKIDLVLLLQPTSPLRTSKHIIDVIEMYNDTCDMIVSVKQSHVPSVLCKENLDGFLELLINVGGDRRQELESFYEYNGAIYLLNASLLWNKNIHGLIRKKKYVMNSIQSVDIDTIEDLKLAEFYKKEYNL